MSSSIRFNLPFLAPGQAQKELFHNEALQLLDIIVAACVEEPPRSSPPAVPATGAAYIVQSGSSGDWSGFTDHIAAFTEAGWRFIAPRDGLKAWVRSTNSTAVFRQGAWHFGVLSGSQLMLGGQQVVSTRGAAVTAPSGGPVIDSEARTAIQAILERLQEHGLIAQP